MKDKNNNEERRHGRWIPASGFQGYAKIFRCSICGTKIEVEDWTISAFVGVDVCPTCGALMDQEAEQWQG